MKNPDNHTLKTEIEVTPQSEDYAAILDACELSYSRADYYLQVMEITRVQGWILHISVISAQLPELLKVVIPLLIKERTPFKIPNSKIVADNLLAGMLGYTQLGKVICIYPESDEKALQLAEQLGVLTQPYKGPAIPTDIHLSGLVYTRYGSFNPIIKVDANGSRNKYIYDAQGKLAPDNYPIPFTLPEGIVWPFEKIASVRRLQAKKFMNDLIKPVAIIKSDAKGQVIKGMYLKSWFQARYCVVKEGKHNMYVDEDGRDIQDRLTWQLKVHKELADKIPMPKVLDFFRENNEAYLVMEFIKGIPLDQKILSIYAGRSWVQLSANERLVLVDYLLKVIAIIDALHQRNYVHRDLTPGNFLIRKNETLCLIDFELAYSLSRQEPSPPFGLATDGFMAPELLEGKTPTVKEDVYSLGAIMIVIFTSLLPSLFDTATDDLHAKLAFFVTDVEVALLIASCLHKNPAYRPTLQQIMEVIQRYRGKLQVSQAGGTVASSVAVNKEQLLVVINQGLHGLASGLMTGDKGLWFSKTVQTNPSVLNPQTSFSLYPGIYEGVSGVLYALSQIAGCGVTITENISEYFQHNTAYIEKTYLSDQSAIPAGLYTGSAGIAVALAAGMDTGLLKETATNNLYIRNCLEQMPGGVDLVSGVAGLGLAILRCRHYLPADLAINTLDKITALLLKRQQSDGSWLSFLDPNDKKGMKISGLSQGIAGIICYLLRVTDNYQDSAAKNAAIKALYWLQKTAFKKHNTYAWYTDTVSRQFDLWVHNGITGIALAFIKAYEILQDPVYRKMAEGALSCHPRYVVTRNLSHAWGLSGLGEVYLEATRVLKAEEWQMRADWIASSLVHLRRQQNDDTCYWRTNAYDLTHTADFMTGNSGVIHFLARYLAPGQISYPLI